MAITGWDEAVGVLKATVVASESLLQAQDVENVWELIDAGEPGVAFEILCTQLYEYGATLDEESLGALIKVGTYFRLDPKLWTDLANV